MEGLPENTLVRHNILYNAVSTDNWTDGNPVVTNAVCAPRVIHERVEVPGPDAFAIPCLILTVLLVFVMVLSWLVLKHTKKAAKADAAELVALYEDRMNKIIFADHVIYGDEDYEKLEAENELLRTELESYRNMRQLNGFSDLQQGAMIQAQFGGIANAYNQFRKNFYTCTSELPRPMVWVDGKEEGKGEHNG